MKKNLLVVTNCFPYETDMSGVFIKEQIKKLKTAFEKVIVISPMAYFPKGLLHFEKFRTYCGHNFYPTSYIYENVEVFFPKYFPFPDLGNISKSIRNYLFLNATDRLIKKKKIDFDIIHSHFIDYTANTGAKLKMKYAKPLILTSNGGDIYQFPFHNKKWLETIKKTLNDADKIIAVSVRNRDILINRLDVSAKKIIVQHSGVDIKLFKPLNKEKAREKLGLSKNKKIVLSIGHLIEIKGHKYLIEAMRDIINYQNDISCIIVGSGVLKEKLINLVKKLKLETYVKLVGETTHKNIPYSINACDVFILPSLDEGHPSVMNEALACGKPVIATNVGGIPETIKKEFLGEIVVPKNSEMLAKAIKKALEKKWNANKIAEYAKQNLSLERACSQIIDVYNQVLYDSSNK